MKIFPVTYEMSQTERFSVSVLSGEQVSLERNEKMQSQAKYIFNKPIFLLVQETKQEYRHGNLVIYNIYCNAYCYCACIFEGQMIQML